MSGIKLKTAGGGSITLQPENTGVDISLTVPADNSMLVSASDLAASSGAAGVGYLPAGTGAVATNVQQVLQETVSVFRFMTASQIADALAGTVTLDLTTAIQAALNSGATEVRLPQGRFKVTPQANGAALIVPDGVNFIGDPSGSELYMVTDATNDPNTSVWWDVILFTGSRTKWSSVKGIKIRHSGGSRNNCASIAVRNNASKVEIVDNDISGSIASGIVVEGSVSSPYYTGCRVRYNKISNANRHGVYISGATGNEVFKNAITNTVLESIVNRNSSDTDIISNTIVGDGATYPLHAIAMAAPAGVIYAISRLRIIGNRVYNVPGSGFYGQGLGVTITDSEIHENIIQAMTVGTFHAMMLFRVSRSSIKENKIYGGANRGIMLYGCQNNEIVSNNITNVNSNNNSVGVMFFDSYTDPVDSTTTYSTGNNIDRNKIVDDRVIPKHVYGIQFFTGSSPNKVGNNLITGQTSSAYVASDGWSSFYLPSGEDRQWYYGTISSGNTASTQIPVIGNTYSDAVNDLGWLKSLTLITRQTITSGTITATLYKNGSVFRSVTLTGDGSVTLARLNDMPGQFSVSPGDRLTLFFTASNIVTSLPVDILVRAKFAAF